MDHVCETCGQNWLWKCECPEQFDCPTHGATTIVNVDLDKGEWADLACGCRYTD